jgi:quinol monooxygenase YgiN
MIPEILRYEIPPERVDDFLAAYTAAGEVLKTSPHCLGYEMLRSEKDARLFLLTILWDSAEGHLEGFRKSAAFRQFFALIKDYLPMIKEMEHYALTPIAWTAPAQKGGQS